MRSSGALRIGEPRQRRAEAPAFQRAMRPKKEQTEEDQEGEWIGLKEAEEASFNILQPADPAFAESWSLKEHTEEELELQRQLLAEAERARAEREAQEAANAARRRVPPPPQPKEVPYIVLDPDTDEDEEYARALELSRWGGDAGAGPSTRHDAGEGPSSDDDGGGDDYSQAIAASLGLI